MASEGSAAGNKPISILHISKQHGMATPPGQADAGAEGGKGAAAPPPRPDPPARPGAAAGADHAGDRQDQDSGSAGLEAGLTMADLLGPADQGRGRGGDNSRFLGYGQRRSRPGRQPASGVTEQQQGSGAQTMPQQPSYTPRDVDHFDFDEDTFLAALDDSVPVSGTGDVARGRVLGHESDGIYVDIAGKAPGWMPKQDCGLGVIGNLEESFPRGMEIDVLITREQNADGQVTVSARALALRESWKTVERLAAQGAVVQVRVCGFNRGGCTCELEGLRGFIPRSQLNDGGNHTALVGKTLGVTFLEVNPASHKLVLSEKRAAIAVRLSELKVGSVQQGRIDAIKPYGFFVDLGGVSGLLHQSCITGGALRSLRQAFDVGETVQVLITDVDAARGRIGLSTALLEDQPGELLIDKARVMAEARIRAARAFKSLQNRTGQGEDGRPPSPATATDSAAPSSAMADPAPIRPGPLPGDDSCP